MRPKEVAFDIWLRLEQTASVNPFKTTAARFNSTLNRLLKDGSIVRLRRGVYALSEDSQFEVFRESMMADCRTDPQDTAFVTASVGAAPSGWL
jgi:hypothetical protein